MNEHKKNNSSGFIWNMVGAGIVACQASILMIFAARFYNQETSGIISIAYAIAVLTFTISRYGVRNYQVADINEEFSYEQYLKSRCVTIFVTLVGTVIYLFTFCLVGKYSLDKAIIILEVVFLRMVNSLEDVYLGRYQQKGFFSVGARIMAIREILILLVMSILMFNRFSLVYVFGVGVIISIVIEIALINYNYSKLLIERKNIKHDIKIRYILYECFPLCVGSSLAVYISNIPKYITDWYLDEYAQAIVGYLILPVFVVSLLSQFIYTPFVKELVDMNAKKKEYFYFEVLKQVGVIVIISMVVLFFTIFVGLSVLSGIYNIDLTSYKMEFCILLLGGTFYALGYYMTIPITIIKKQRIIAVVYSVSILVATVLQKRMVLYHGIVGVSLLYFIVNMMVSMFFLIVFVKSNRERTTMK